jgi:hypothetical protein
MSVAIINRKERFATEGVRFMRHNSDGTIAAPHRFIGFANTADLSKVLYGGEAPLTIKINAEPAITKKVDFSGVADKARVTVLEAVDALNDAKFDDIVFSVDEITGRLKGAVAKEGGPKARDIQIVSPLAAALDFGQGIRHGGNGLEWISFFDDETISIGLPKNIKDKEEIDQEGAKGTITRMIIGAMLLGLSPVITLKEKDYYLLELIQGGLLDREEGTYNPPLSGESEHPSFCAEVFSAIYPRGSSKLSDMSGYERLFLRNMTGIESDVPVDAKAWATYAFNTTATEYSDESNQRFPAWEEQTLSKEKFDSLNLKRLKVAA